MIALVPNLLPLLSVFATMGFFHIDLDIATATVAAIALGIGIDDTIHFIYHWKKAEIENYSWEQCYHRVLMHAGRVAIMTTLILVIGYPVLAFGSVYSIKYFILLIVISAFIALISDLVLLHILLKLWPSNKNLKLAGSTDRVGGINPVLSHHPAYGSVPRRLINS